MQPNTESSVRDDHLTILRTMTQVMRDDGILYGVALPHSVQQIEDAVENLASVRRLSNNKRVPMLMDIRATGTLSRDARLYYAGPEVSGAVTAVGFVANSAFGRVVANLLIRLSKTNYPMRLFTTTESALDWLRDHR